MAESLRYVWLLRTFHVKHIGIGAVACEMDAPPAVE
jgi:hypothetical protein